MDLCAILKCINAGEMLKKLKLCGMIGISGEGLEPLRGSTTIEQLDLGLVGQHDSPDMSIKPSLNEDKVLQVLDSIIQANECVLKHIQLPHHFLSRKSIDIASFLERYEEYLLNRNELCNECGGGCEGTDWVCQSGDGFGLQNFTCSVCTNVFCNSSTCKASVGRCETCKKEYCKNCDYVKQCKGIRCYKNTCSSCSLKEGCDDCIHYTGMTVAGGTEIVNGVYKYDGNWNDAEKYTRTTHVDGREESISIFRQERRGYFVVNEVWHISIIKNSNLRSADNSVVYRAHSKEKPFGRPTNKEWHSQPGNASPTTLAITPIAGIEAPHIECTFGKCSEKDYDFCEDCDERACDKCIVKCGIDGCETNCCKSCMMKHFENCEGCDKAVCYSCLEGYDDIEVCEHCTDGHCSSCKWEKFEESQYIECEGLCDKICCIGCLQQCQGCGKKRCPKCMTLLKCENKECQKAHCDSCFGEEYDVQRCNECDRVFCSSCRDSENRKSSCDGCMNIDDLSDDDMKVLEEAIEAVPALFAKPGDVFECEGEGFIYYTSCGMEETYLTFVGRNENQSRAIEINGETSEAFKSPKKGWLIFKDDYNGKGIDRINGGVRDVLGAWPMDCYSQYDEDGKVIRGTLCVPPAMCGPLSFPRRYCYEEEEQTPRPPVKRIEDCSVSKMLFHEVKMAAPALLAKPGDMFMWDGGYAESLPAVFKYTGRNETPPEMTSRITRTNQPQLGWLVFRNKKNYSSVDSCPGIRDVIDARPSDVYQHYSKRGARQDGTLCIPPKKCGSIKLFDHRVWY